MMNPFNPSGRLSRGKYFWYSLAVAVLFVLSLVLLAAISPEDPSPPLSLLGVAAYIFWVILGVLLSIGRLHDLSKSGWYCLLFLVPIANLFLGVYLLFAKGTVGPNRFGPDPLAEKAPTTLVADGVEPAPSKEDEERARSLVLHGTEHQKAGTDQWSEAELAFRQALKLDPVNFDARYRLGALLMSRAVNASSSGPKGKAKRLSKEASSNLHGAVELNPDHPGPHYELARSEWISVKAAAEEYSIALRLDQAAGSEYGKHHWNVAQRMSASGQHELAVQAFRSAIRCDPEYWGGHVRPSREPALSHWRQAMQLEGRG